MYYKWETLAWFGNGLSLRVSTLQNAGWGVFALKTFEKNDVVCEYSGEIANSLPRNWEYSLRLNRTQWLTGFDSKVLCRTRDNAGSMVNDARDSKKQNCCFWRCSETPIGLKPSQNTGRHSLMRVFLVATRRITENEELFVPYGEAFWMRFESVPVSSFLRSNNKNLRMPKCGEQVFCLSV
jgi:SET domain-containing protein